MSKDSFTPVFTLEVPGEGNLCIGPVEDGPTIEKLLGTPLVSFLLRHGEGGNEDCYGLFDIKCINTEKVALLCRGCGLRIPLPKTAGGTLSRFILWVTESGWTVAQSFTPLDRLGSLLVRIGRG